MDISGKVDFSGFSRKALATGLFLFTYISTHIHAGPPWLAGAGRLVLPNARITAEPATSVPVRVRDVDSIYYGIDITSANWYHGLNTH